MFSQELLHEAEQLLSFYRKKGMRIATAESCTGGLIAALLTEIPGSSDVYDRGFITYSNDAKCVQLSVPLSDVNEFGAVSEEVATSMAYGALDNSAADVAIAVTGVAGPGGGSKLKPVGLVYIAVAARNNEAMVERCKFEGSRSEIRMQAVEVALQLLKQVAKPSSVAFA